MLLQDTLFATANPASTQELKPIAILSFSTVLHHVSLGLPLLRFPSSAHVRETRAWEAAVVQVKHVPYPCSSPFPNLFADGLSVGSPAYFFIGHAHRPIDS